MHRHITDTFPRKVIVPKKINDNNTNLDATSVTTNNIVDGSFSVADSTPLKVEDDSIVINSPIKVDGEVLEIDLSRLNDEEKKQFSTLLKKIQKSKVWKPEMLEPYFYITYSGTICKSHWQDGQGNFNAYAIGNCFQTEDDAIFAAEKLKIETEIKRYIEEHDPIKTDWKDRKNHKCYLVYNTSMDRIEVKNCMVQRQFGAIYFSSKLDWYKMINTIGVNRIKEYIFGVE